MPLPQNSSASRITNTKLGDAEKALATCKEIEAELAELQAAYEQYFLGMERRPPIQKHEDLKKRVNALRNTFVNSTTVKFRVSTLQQRLSTFERLWERSLQEIEAGTYRRDLFKARRHAEQRQKKKTPAAAKDELDDLHIDEDLDLSDLGENESLDSALVAAAAAVAKPKPAQLPTIPSVAPLPAAGSVSQKVAPLSTPSIAPVIPPVGGRPATVVPPVASSTSVARAAPVTKAPASRPPSVPGSAPSTHPSGAPSRPPPSATPDGGLNDGKIKAIYDAYLLAKRRCGEDTSKLSLDSVATTLRSQVPALLKQHNAKSVEFKVVIKDGRAVLRALPKE